jgi:NAD(P)-dependent dehydrogenase (short-subunit alcohol dehydrogenase family)/threonine dehydrogenase-like Zn-dependent dehydrogenase
MSADARTAPVESAPPVELPREMWLWPLYGKGLENLGAGGRPIRAPVKPPAPDQLLVRIDASGMCFSDIKIIAQGPEHPRLVGRDMERDPVVLGHEVAMTAVAVGEKLRDRYRPGDRFVIQADITYRGQGMAFGYRLQGGMAQYALIGPEVLEGDDGNYLLPLRPETGYSQAALCEPWACVLASYRVEYRRAMKVGGTAWIIGNGSEEGFTVSAGAGCWDKDAHPARAVLTVPPKGFRALLEERAKAAGFAGDVAIEERGDLDSIPSLAADLAGKIDDLVFLGAPRPTSVPDAMTALGKRGIVNILSEKPVEGPAGIDIGRIHYENWTVVGAPSRDLAAGYRTGVRSELKPGGSAWFVGAAGPMGRMHVQRAIEMEGGPGNILATDISTPRLDHLVKSFGQQAAARGVRLLALNPAELKPEDYAGRLREFTVGSGFDDIVMLVPAPALIAESFPHLAAGGVMNVFAGIARGVKASIDLSLCYGGRQARITGTSGSAIGDMLGMVKESEAGRLSTDRATAAIGGLRAVRDGYEAVKGSRFPGKIVIYPQVLDFPLTPVDELPSKEPAVAAKLRDGQWCREAERAFLEAKVRAETPPCGSLAGKVALVTGGGQGLGKALADRLAAEGAWVVVADIDEARAKAAAREIEAARQRRTIHIRADVTSEGDMDRAAGEAVAAFGSLDILVSNAGILIAGELTEIPIEKWRRVIEVNLVGYFVSARAAAKVMKRQKRGAIVQINSKSGKKGSFQSSAYASSKFGGIGLTQSIALDLAPYGVRVNSVCPGNLLDSPLWQDSLYEQYAKKWGITVEEVRRKYLEQVPLGRGCDYDDVANVVVFLASDKASYMTGQAINVTGGQEMR